MNISRLLGATMVAGAGSPEGGRAGASTAPAAPAWRDKLRLRARAREDSRPAPQHGHSIAKVAR